MLRNAGAGVIGAELTLGKPEAEDYAQKAINKINEIPPRLERCSSSGFFPTEGQKSSIEQAKICQSYLSEFLELHQQCRSLSGK